MVNDLLRAKEIVLSYINSESSKQIFLTTNNIDNDKLKDCIAIIKNYASKSDIYTDCFLEEFKDIVLSIIDISQGIKNGVVKKDGSIRKYNIVDFYLNKKASLKFIEKIALEVLDRDDALSIKSFLYKNGLIKYSGQHAPLPITLDYILRERCEVNCAKDKYGNIIVGSGRVITDEEKTMIYDFMNKNNIPNNIRFYNIVLNSYLNDDLCINSESKELKLKLKCNK